MTTFTEVPTNDFFGNHYSEHIAARNKYAVPNFTSPSGMADILFLRYGSDTIMVDAFVGVNDLWLLDDSGAPIPPVTQPPITIPPIGVQPPVVIPPVKPPEVPPVTVTPNNDNSIIQATVNSSIVFPWTTVGTGEVVTFEVLPFRHMWEPTGHESYSWKLSGAGNVDSIEAKPTFKYDARGTYAISVAVGVPGNVGLVTAVLKVEGERIVPIPPIDPPPFDPDLYDANGVRWSATNPPPDVEDGLDYPAVAQRYRRYQYQNPAFATITKSDVIAYRTLALPPNSVFTDRGVPELNTIGVWVRANRPTTNKEIDAWIAGGKVLA